MAFLNNKPDNLLRIHIGPFASGAAVLTDLTVVRDIVEHSRKLLGFDMEAYGVILSGDLACNPKPISIVMKSVSDFGDAEKTTTIKNIQPPLRPHKK